MKRKSIFILSAVCAVILGIALGFAGCGKQKRLPAAKEGALTYFTLDVYGERDRTLSVSDYIDEKGLAVTYAVSAASEGIVSVTEVEEGSFRVTAVAAGRETLTLTASAEDGAISVRIFVSVISDAPDAPRFSEAEYSYDKAAGGIAELPAEVGNGLPSLVRVNGKRLQERYWRYDEEKECLTLEAAYAEELALGVYPVTLITTGGSADCSFHVINSVVTAFDPVTEKSAIIGSGEGTVAFSVQFGGATVRGISYGDYELTEEDYNVTAEGIEIKERFYSHTCESSPAVYRLRLSNHDVYEFSVRTNAVFYTDYDITTIHSSLVSSTGLNPLYQDSTRVEIADAPEGSGLTGRVLKYTPHVGTVSLDVYGIYTLERSGGTSTWYKVDFTEGKQYTVSFDYVTEDTTAGEDFRFRSWGSGASSPALDTGSPGTTKHFSYSFVWRDTMVGVFLFGRFLNGGCIYIDNFSIVEARTSSSAPLPDTTDYGGRVPVSFDALSENFTVYTENHYTARGTEVFAADGDLFCAGRVETKIMYGGRSDLSTFALSATFSPLGESLALSAGFYLYASGVTGALDGLTGYAVVLERDRGSDSCVLNVHRFAAGSWIGSVAKCNFRMHAEEVPMRVTADEGRVRVYLYGGQAAALDIRLPAWEAGRVGFRVFRGRGARISDFSLSAPDIPVDTSELLAAAERGQAVRAEEYTATSYAALAEALERARNAETQSETDAALADLDAAFSGLVRICTFDELRALIGEGRIARAGRFTENSKASLLLALDEAEACTAESGESISVAAARLSAALARLIAL